ncbi:hypothetical protein, partial [Fischerella thermalis]|uniref:hypothetical protein n=1 Tax=Fischerella thermalis TaxID=372787 RepID=UPI001CA5B0A7
TLELVLFLHSLYHTKVVFRKFLTDLWQRAVKIFVYVLLSQYTIWVHKRTYRSGCSASNHDDRKMSIL